MTRRLGPEVVHQLSRELIGKARREKRFRPRAARIDSTVVEADIRYPTDSGLGGRRRPGAGARGAQAGGQDRRQAHRGQGSLTRGRAPVARDHAHDAPPLRAGQGGRAQADQADGRAACPLGQGGAAARRRGQAPGPGRGAQAKLKAARQLEQLADRCEKVVEQITKRLKGEKITDRLISLWDPDARPIRKGKLSQPNQFGYVDQLCEITANTKPGARGFILPPSSQIGNPGEDTLLPATAAELQNLDIKLREVMVDGGFNQAPTNTALEGLADEVHITGRQEPGPRRTRRRRQRYRTGAEGRVSHLKRGYGLRRSRLKGDEGHQIWDGWAAFTYNADTYTTLP